MAVNEPDMPQEVRKSPVGISFNRRVFILVELTKRYFKFACVEDTE